MQKRINVHMHTILEHRRVHIAVKPENKSLKKSESNHEACNVNATLD